MMAQRATDMRAEQALAQFLDQNLYRQLVRQGVFKSYRRVADVTLQKQGADVIAEAAGRQLVIDEKAQLHYINNTLPTFILELDYILNGSLIDGWFLNDHLRTTHYLFLWPNAVTTDLSRITSADFTAVEAMLVSKEKLRSHVEGLGLDRARLRELARALRRDRPQGSQPISIDGGPPIPDLKLHLSLDLREQPVNLVIRKRLLKELAGPKGHCVIRGAHGG